MKLHARKNSIKTLAKDSTNSMYRPSADSQIRRNTAPKGESGIFFLIVRNNSVSYRSYNNFVISRVRLAKNRYSAVTLLSVLQPAATLESFRLKSFASAAIEKSNLPRSRRACIRYKTCLSVARKAASTRVGNARVT